jgi:hypothetical protein
MKRNSLKRAPGRKRGNNALHQLESASVLEDRLLEILKNLARVLVLSGYGIGGLSKLTRRAYFDAALALNSEQGWRLNNARIAALTGLTRSEVSNLAHQRSLGVLTGTGPVNRAQRVSIGWVNDEEFCDKQGDPNILPFSGRRASFEKLVKNYSGDIPARAMLSEMLRLGMAREEVDGCVRLVRIDAPMSRRTVATLRAISPWISFISESSDDEAEDLNANTARIQLNFDSMAQLFAAIREIQERATAFVRSVQELGHKRRTAHGRTLQISIGLATRIPRVKGAPKKKKIGTSKWLNRNPK